VRVEIIRGAQTGVPDSAVERLRSILSGNRDVARAVLYEDVLVEDGVRVDACPWFGILPAVDPDDPRFHAVFVTTTDLVRPVLTAIGVAETASGVDEDDWAAGIVVVDRPELVPPDDEYDDEDEDDDEPYELPPGLFLPPRSELSAEQLATLGAALDARTDVVGAYLVLHRIGGLPEHEQEAAFLELADPPTRHDDIRPFVWSLRRSLGDSHQAGFEWSVAVTEILPALREVATVVWRSDSA
jgi:hypothetical protein